MKPSLQQRMCGTKKKFNDHRSALATARSINLQENNKLGVYECPFCGKWHIGHNKPLSENTW